MLKDVQITGAPGNSHLVVVQIRNRARSTVLSFSSAQLNVFPWCEQPRQKSFYGLWSPFS
jgi:hypothetical protein